MHCFKLSKNYRYTYSNLSSIIKGYFDFETSEKGKEKFFKILLDIKIIESCNFKYP